MAEQGIINNIVSENAVKQIDALLIKLSAAYATMEKLVGMQIGGKGGASPTTGSGASGDTAQITRMKELDAALRKVVSLENQIQTLREKGSTIHSSTNQKIAEETQRLQALTREQKLRIQLNNAEEGSYNKLSAQYSLNVIALNKMSKAQRENTDEGKALTASTKALKDEMITLKEQTSDHTLKVGRYTDALGQLPGSFGQAASSAKAYGLQLWKLVANPIGMTIAAIVGGLTLLFKAFKSTDDGANMLAGVFKALSNVMDILLDRVFSFGKLIGSIVTLDWEGIKKNGKDAFEGVGKAIADAASAGYQYIQAMDDIADREAASLIRTAKLKNEISDLRVLSKDQTKTARERLGFLDLALSKEKQVFDIERGFAKERLYAGERDLASKINNSKLTIDQKRLELVKWLSYSDVQINAEKKKNTAFAEFINTNEEAFQALQKQSSEYIGMSGEFVDMTRRQRSERTGYLKEVLAENEANKKALKTKAEELSIIKKLSVSYSEIENTLAKTTGNGTEAFEKRLEIAGNVLKNLMTKEQRAEYEKYINSLNENTIDIDQKIQDKKNDIIAKGWDLARQLGESYFSWYSEKLQKEGEDYKTANDQKLKELEESNKAGLITDEEYQTQKDQLEADAKAKQNEIDKKERQAKKEAFLLNQAIAMAQVWIDYAKATGASGFNPLLQPWYLGEAVAMSALIAAQSIPYFANGGTMESDGLAVVGDGGRKEAVTTPSGFTYITPDVPTLTYLEKGTKIVPDASMLTNDAITRMAMLNINQSNTFDTTKLEKKLDRLIELEARPQKGEKKLSLMEQIKIAERLKLN